MTKRNLIIIAVIVLASVWWVFHKAPETEVREAHQELVRLMNKTEEAATSSMLVNARLLQGLFHDVCDVSGDAEMFVDSYTRDEMVSTIIQVQSMFTTVELTFHELVVEFPAEDEALANFTAVLVGRSTMTEGEEVAETRAVVSRLRNIDGEWLFSEFRLTKIADDSGQ